MIRFTIKGKAGITINVELPDESTAQEVQAIKQDTQQLADSFESKEHFEEVISAVAIEQRSGKAKTAREAVLNSFPFNRKH